MSMHLVQSTWEAIEQDTEDENRLVVIVYRSSDRHRSVAGGTIIYCMLVHRQRDHGLLHLSGKDNWRHMTCGGSCSSCSSVDQPFGIATAKRALEGFDTSDSVWAQGRSDSHSVGPRSATVSPRTSTLSFRGPPPRTASSSRGSMPRSIMTSNKIPQVFQVENDP